MGRERIGTTGPDSNAMSASVEILVYLFDLQL